MDLSDSGMKVASFEIEYQKCASQNLCFLKHTNIMAVLFTK